jgi:peptidoglycan hydrolase-like protein with peptidoglycan-binding domain
MALDNGKKLNPYAVPTSSVIFGDIGTDVRWVQWELREAGYNVKITGEFNTATEKAVKAFQKAHSLEVDGHVGPITRAEFLKRLLS